MSYVVEDFYGKVVVGMMSKFEDKYIIIFFNINVLNFILVDKIMIVCISFCVEF